MANNDITQEAAKRMFSYKENNLYWNKRPMSDFKTKRGRNIFNSSYAGKISGSVNTIGYRFIKIGNRDHSAHRIIWIFHFGKIPANMQIDHINHIRSDNSIDNLRIVSEPDNHKNLSKRKSNKSGATGVCFVSRTKKWTAYIRVNGKLLFLGNFTSKESAIKERLKAEVKYGFHKNHGN